MDWGVSISAVAEICYQNSCQSRFSGVHLIFEMSQDTWHSNKENPSAYWNVSPRSRSDLVLDADIP